VGKGDTYGKCWAASKDEAKEVTDVYKHLFPLAIGLEDACVQGFSNSECFSSEGIGGYNVQLVGKNKPMVASCCPKCVIDTGLLAECTEEASGSKCKPSQIRVISLNTDAVEVYYCCPKTTTR
jgi:hypothetical protein